MKNTKTKEIVLIGVLTALGVILNLIEIPYPLAPWLNLDLSEIVVLAAVSIIGIKGAIIVSLAKFLVSIIIKGPVGPLAIGQITALIASLTIAITFYLIDRHLNLDNKKLKYLVTMLGTVLVFASVMFIINYLFVTPTYLMQKPTWYTNMPFSLSIDSFNQQYGSNFSIPEWLGFLSPYAQAIFIIYFPFNFLKGIVISCIYSLVRPLEKYFKNQINK